MALDVKVKIDINKPTGELDYSFPLILDVLSDGATAVSYAEYGKLDDISNAGFTSDTNAYKAATLVLSQDDAPEKAAIVSCAAGSEVETITACVNNGWRQLVVVCEGDESAPAVATIKAISDYIETTRKMYFCSVAKASDTGTLTKTNARTVVLVYTDASVICPEAAIVGASAGLDAGSFTYKNLVIAGVEPLELSDEEITAIHEAGAITLVTKAGDNVLTEGKTLSGDYIDIVDSEDFVISGIEYNVQKVFNNAKKVPYDNNGIAMLESAVIEVMREAYNNGIITDDEDGSPAYEVSFALRSATTETDRANRKYPYGTFSFTLAGAIHEAEVTGEITI